MLEALSALFVVVNALVKVVDTVRANKRAAHALLAEWTTLGDQLRALYEQGRIGVAQSAPFERLVALAETTKAFLLQFAERGLLKRNLGYAADRDRFRELAERLASEVASLKLGLSIDANTTLLQMEEAHAQDMAELHADLTALQAATTHTAAKTDELKAAATHTAAQNDEIKAMLSAVLAHMTADARPRAERATLTLRAQAETPTIKVRARAALASACWPPLSRRAPCDATARTRVGAPRRARLAAVQCPAGL